jgi:CHAD domain-containing protein
MRYRFKESETVDEGVRRITLEQIDKSISSLNPEIGNKDRAIHQARVCFKRIRAIIRMVKDDLGPEVYERENIAYRDAGRRLSAARDVAVTVRSLEEIVRDFGSQLETTGIKRLRKQLLKSKVHQQVDRRIILGEAAGTVRSARQRVETWPGFHDDFSSLRAGFRRTYRRGFNAYRMICDDPRTENLHEWRKQVKYLWYQVSLVHSVWPKLLDVLAGELSKLASYLSEDHDLALLRNTALELIQDAAESGRIESFVSLLDGRRLTLQTKAKVLGARLYAESPGAFANRMRTYWEQWRPLAAIPSALDPQTTFASVDSTFACLFREAEPRISSSRGD